MVGVSPFGLQNLKNYVKRTEENNFSSKHNFKHNGDVIKGNYYGLEGYTNAGLMLVSTKELQNLSSLDLMELKHHNRNPPPPPPPGAPAPPRKIGKKRAKKLAEIERE